MHQTPPDKNDSSTLIECLNFHSQLNFTKANTPGKMNTVADILSHSDMDTNEKIILQI